MNCLNCKSLLTKESQVSFCSKSCSASHNNIGVRRHGKIPANCIYCGAKCQNSKSKFCSRECMLVGKKKIALDNIVKTGKVPFTSSIARLYLIELRGHRCEICSIEEWTGVPVPLTMDHINGDSTNNSLDNLRMICPNCDALLPTYAGRNKGNGRASRRERYRRLGYC